MFCDRENYTSAPPKYSPSYNFDYHLYAKLYKKNIIFDFLSIRFNEHLSIKCTFFYILTSRKPDKTLP